ncbi:class F sortase, partial [Arthrobacter sp. Hiyo1]|uniref:class F sortase n=1 Tax=Arthrobacter sp. Hiyo1 TaxID=1588020 RepID=UPI000AAEB4AD
PAAASAPVQITYPAVGLDVLVHPLRPDPAGGQSIEPPETMDGYWLSPFGTPGTGSTNTTYVIGHSWEGLDAPFNHLSYAAAPGDELKVVTATGAMTYKVDSVTTYTKSTLKDSPVWTAVPNRLVLISCYTQDLWGKNVAVVASLVPGQ